MLDQLSKVMGSLMVRRLIFLILIGCEGAVPAWSLSDGDGTSEPPAKRVTAKVDAPAPLTERERWLLDRVEQLEKRVADLESKGESTTAPATNASVAQPLSANATISAAVADSGITAAPTTANSDALSDN